MPVFVSRNRADRFAAWLDNNRVGILVLSVLLAALGGYLASRMSIKPDLINLLPSSQRSVKDLVSITKRARPFGTVQIVIESEDLALRAKAGGALTARLARSVAPFSVVTRRVRSPAPTSGPPDNTSSDATRMSCSCSSSSSGSGRNSTCHSGSACSSTRGRPSRRSNARRGRERRFRRAISSSSARTASARRRGISPCSRSNSAGERYTV